VPAVAGRNAELLLSSGGLNTQARQLLGSRRWPRRGEAWHFGARVCSPSSYDLEGANSCNGLVNLTEL
jgi:hypothetical protein